MDSFPVIHFIQNKNMVENKFWLVKSLEERSRSYEMFNGVPHRVLYSDIKFWTARHGHCYLGEQSLGKVTDITSETEPVQVKLVQTDNDIPDFYVQRYGDCLFINYRTEKYYKPCKRKLIGWKHIEVERVPHIYQISNKLFPEITEESGIVKFNIERI